MIPIAIVCRPDFLMALRDSALESEEKEIPYIPAFIGLPIHEKIGQKEAWKVFYNLDDLYNYLSDNGKNPISRKNDEIAEMLENARNTSK